MEKYYATAAGDRGNVDQWYPYDAPTGYWRIEKATFDKFFELQYKVSIEGSPTYNANKITIKKHDSYDEANGVFDAYITATWLDDTVEQTFIKEEIIWSDLQK